MAKYHSKVSSAASSSANCKSI